MDAFMTGLCYNKRSTRGEEDAMPNWTREQLDAITDRGHSLIVCAAAGSGKTAVLVDKGQRSSIASEVTLEESITAPVSKGQRLGTLTVRSGQQILAQMPLVAAESVTRLTAWDLAVQILRQVAMAG